MEQHFYKRQVCFIVVQYKKNYMLIVLWMVHLPSAELVWASSLETGALSIGVMQQQWQIFLLFNILKLLKKTISQPQH